MYLDHCVLSWAILFHVMFDGMFVLSTAEMTVLSNTGGRERAVDEAAYFPKSILLGVLSFCILAICPANSIMRVSIFTLNGHNSDLRSVYLCDVRFIE